MYVYIHVHIYVHIIYKIYTYMCYTVFMCVCAYHSAPVESEDNLQEMLPFFLS